MDFGDFRLTNWVLDDPAANPDMWWDDKMPLITPAYPTMNSLFAVSAATYRVMMCELSRGYVYIYIYIYNYHGGTHMTRRTRANIPI
jgi:poly(A) polymerase Pap1